MTDASQLMTLIISPDLDFSATNDNSIESIKAIFKRLHGGMDVYGDYVRKPQADSSNPSIVGKTQKPHCPAFTFWSDHEHQQMLQQTL